MFSSARTLPDTYRLNRDSFERMLWAENKSPRTVRTYLDAVDLLGAYLAAQGMPTEAAHIRREHVEAFIQQQLDRYKPATAANRFRGLQRFFHFLAEEGEVDLSPMARMRPPMVPEALSPVLKPEELDRLLKACGGNDFEARRDTAILRLFIDTGLRRAELAHLSVDDLDFQINSVRVLGKGRRERNVPFGRKTARALDRYLRARHQHKDAALVDLWIGRRGRVSDSGIFQIIRQRPVRRGSASARQPIRLTSLVNHASMCSDGSVCR